MRVKYHIHDEDNPSIVSVAEMTMDEYGIINIAPVNPEFQDIIITGLGKCVYSEAMEQLFDTGRLDMSIFKKNTYYEDEFNVRNGE